MDIDFLSSLARMRNHQNTGGIDGFNNEFLSAHDGRHERLPRSLQIQGLGSIRQNVLNHDSCDQHKRGTQRPHDLFLPINLKASLEKKNPHYGKRMLLAPKW